MQVEKHIRKNKLKLTFTDQLGRAVSVSQDEDSEISSKKEAKKLAFYLFWNMRATLSRSAVTHPPPPQPLPSFYFATPLPSSCWLRLKGSLNAKIAAAVGSHVSLCSVLLCNPIIHLGRS